MGDYGTILTSPDGVNWTARTSGIYQGLQGVTYRKGIFVAVGHYGTIITSPDGVSLAGRTSGTTNNLFGVTYGNGTFVAVGEYGTILQSNSIVMLLTPNRGEVIPSGSTYNIQWMALAEAIKFDLEYSLDNGQSWKPVKGLTGIADDVRGTSFDWTLPKPWGNQKKCLVKVKGYDASGNKVGADKSDAPFRIDVIKVKSPDGGETLTCGVPNTITWTTNETKNDVTKVKLYYTKDKGVNWIPIGKTLGDSGSYDQWIPTCTKIKTNCCKVKVELKDALGNILGADKSDNYFTIQP